ncbi:hypothetical protein TWF718_002783 [Orbilia javanica]|uniref:Glucose-methanol-choline oxidoreductase C-terminal domain-containing protein n=1 Tax=Orbilia javanica TaxID=47235 RepID=A0AAN8NKY3_9PEZI
MAQGAHMAFGDHRNPVIRPGDLPPYLRTPGRTIPSFHNRASKHAGSAKKQPTNTCGYPLPGVQNPSATSVMAQDYFVSDDTWAKILKEGQFDYIVVGSGLTALAFIDETLKLDPMKKILCLERGDFWLPTHFQNLPLPFKMVLGGPSETFPWTLSRKTYEEKSLGFCHGSCPFFGGRSTFWSAWCPQPSKELMRDFPESMIKTAEDPKFWNDAKKLLNVVSAKNINDPVYKDLQGVIDEIMQRTLPELQKQGFADSVEPAQLAVGRSPGSRSYYRFNKFSTPGPLLAIYEKQRNLAKKSPVEGMPLEIMLNCTVNHLRSLPDDESNYVRFIETSQGTLSWIDDNTKIILCAGAIPNATLLLNSFKDCRPSEGGHVGERITGHFLTHIAARYPAKYFEGGEWRPGGLHIAAEYLAGRGKARGECDGDRGQFHVQITAIHTSNPEGDADDAARECPDYAAAATYEQLKDSKDHVVFVCASLGELSENNDSTKMKLNDTKDPSSNITLQFTLDQKDRDLWDDMDAATYKTIEALCSGNQLESDGKLPPIEYWDTDANEGEGGWSTKKPKQHTIRIPGIVHEAATAYVGEKETGGSLDKYYRPHGIKNVFVTGGALFPTSGSWNPTLTMCGYAQDLAKKLHEGIPEE